MWGEGGGLAEGIPGGGPEGGTIILVGLGLVFFTDFDRFFGCSSGMSILLKWTVRFDGGE